MSFKPFLPHPLLKYWRQHPRLKQAHAKLAHMSLEQAREAAAATRHTIDDVTCYEFTPSRPHDAGAAIVLTLPFANPFRLDMAFRAWLMLHSLQTPRRVIVFPQNTFGNQTFALTSTERAAVRKGDFGAIAKQQAAVLRARGVTRCSIAGYSLGAATGARLFRDLAEAGDISVDRLGLFEPPNVMARSRIELIQAFCKGGREALNRAILDANIPPLTKLRSTDTLRAKLKDYVHFFYFVLSSLLRTNRAIIAGSACPTFASDLAGGYQAYQKAPPKLLLGAARNSAVTPPETVHAIGDELQAASYPVRAITVEHYGHELGDNLAAHTTLMHMALE
jgi:pimeloyl-ACP methyl ester carboxylesterase